MYVFLASASDYSWQRLISYASGYFLQPLRSKSETIHVLKAISSLGSRFKKVGKELAKCTRLNTVNPVLSILCNYVVPVLNVLIFQPFFSNLKHIQKFNFYSFMQLTYITGQVYKRAPH